MRESWSKIFDFFFLAKCHVKAAGNLGAEAARARKRGPLMPPPADLESAVPSPPFFDNTINGSIREQPQCHSTHQKCGEGEQAGKKMPSHRVPEAMVWKCTMSLSVFCYMPVRWGEKTEMGGSWWNDYTVAAMGNRGGGAGKNLRCLTQFYYAQKSPQQKNVKDALHPSLVLLTDFHIIWPRWKAC